MQIKAGTSDAQTGLGLGYGGRSCAVATAHESRGLLLTGECFVLAEMVVEEKGGLGGKELGSLSPQPSHADACPLAVNSTLLTTGSHLAPVTSAPITEPGKSHP